LAGPALNGELLARAVESGFDMLVTMDNNMVHQQNISGFRMQLSRSALDQIAWKTLAR